MKRIWPKNYHRPILLDDRDYEWAVKYPWYIAHKKSISGVSAMCRRAEGIPIDYVYYHLARMIADIANDRDGRVQFKDGNRLNLQRDNLVVKYANKTKVSTSEVKNSGYVFPSPV